MTVAGPPGIGKSRLAGEFIASLEGQATVLAGRCLAYGEGTTYQALLDIARCIGSRFTMAKLVNFEPSPP